MYYARGVMGSLHPTAMRAVRMGKAVEATVACVGTVSTIVAYRTDQVYAPCVSGTLKARSSTEHVAMKSSIQQVLYTAVSTTKAIQNSLYS